MSDLGKYYYYPYEKDSLLSFDEFNNKYIKPEPPLLGLSIADDELTQYNYYLSDKHFKTRIDQTTHEEPDKLKHWIENNFFGQISDSFAICQDDANIIYSKAHLMDTRKHIVNMFYDTKNSDTKIFLKKLLIDTFSKDGAYNRDVFYPDYVDDIDNYLDSSSILFQFEFNRRFILNNQISDLNILNDKIGEYNAKTLKALINKPVVTIKPWRHQEEALKRWYQTKCGIIEMATATGKTLVGLCAIVKLYNDSIDLYPKDGHKKLNVLILSHSLSILNQWRREAINKLGITGYSFNDAGRTLKCDDGYLTIQFNTLQTVSRSPLSYKNIDFLIVDEVHHSAAEKFRNALAVPCRYKMGLSATIDGKERKPILLRYFKSVVYTFGIKDALENGIISDFIWKACVTYLDIKEEEDFEKLSENIKKLFAVILKESRDVTRRIIGDERQIRTIKDFVEIMEIARYSGKDMPANWKLLNVLIFQRRMIIHKSLPKIEKAIEIAELNAREKKCLLFTMDINTCEFIARQLRDKGIDVYVMHSGYSNDENQSTLNHFRSIKQGILISAKMLDEGVDIPDAEIGINVASTKTRLQLVQRIGRILRKKPPGKIPVFYHMIALPLNKNFIDGDDAIDYANDVAWVQSLGMQLGVEVEIIGDKEIDELRDRSERYIKELGDQEISESKKYYGTIKVQSIIDSLDHDLKNKLIDALSNEKQNITDEKWRDIIDHSSKDSLVSHYDTTLSGLWWLLALSGRDPLKLIILLKSRR